MIFFPLKKRKKENREKTETTSGPIMYRFLVIQFFFLMNSRHHVLLLVATFSCQPASAKCIFTPLNSNVILGGCCCCCRIDTYPPPPHHHQHNRPLIHGTDKLKMSVGLDLSFHILEVVIDQPKIIRRRSIILGRRSK